MEIHFDTDGWTQEQINMIQAMAVSILAKENIVYDSINGADGILTVEGATADLDFLNEQAILDEYVIWKEQNDILEAQQQQEEDQKQLLIEQAKQATTKAELQIALNNLIEFLQ